MGQYAAKIASQRRTHPPHAWSSLHWADGAELRKLFRTAFARLRRHISVATLLTIVCIWLVISVPVTILAVCLLRGGHDEDEMPASPALENKPHCL